MIGWISGKVRERMQTSVVVDTGGLGYEVHVPSRLLETIEPSASVELHVYTHLRENELSLYGFSSGFEKKLFLLLISVSGIGPKSALGILSKIRPEEILTAVRAQDAGALQSPGVGRKTAEKIVLELKDRVKDLSVGFDTLAPVPQSALSVEDEVVSALENLGYKRAEAQTALRRAPRDRFETFDGLFREVLSQLGRRP